MKKEDVINIHQAANWKNDQSFTISHTKKTSYDRKMTEEDRARRNRLEDIKNKQLYKEEAWY